MSLRYKLQEDYHKQIPIKLSIPHDSVWMSLDTCGNLTIKKDYAWNGCSPTFSVFDWFYLGTPDGIVDYRTGKPKAYYASLVHDCLLQHQEPLGVSSKQIDHLFLDLLKDARFKQKWLYYLVVRVYSLLFRK